MGLKAEYTPHRHQPAKGYVPRDLDGAYRVNHRLDGMKPAEVWEKAKESKG